MDDESFDDDFPVELFMPPSPRESPELTLAHAVFVDGVRAYLRDGRRDNLAHLWFWSPRHAEDGPFGFVSLCGVFGLDPGAVRAAAQRLGIGAHRPQMRAHENNVKRHHVQGRRVG